MRGGKRLGADVTAHFVTSQVAQLTKRIQIVINQVDCLALSLQAVVPVISSSRSLTCKKKFQIFLV